MTQSKTSSILSVIMIEPAHGWGYHLAILPRFVLMFGSLVILDVARCYLWLFTLYINIKIGRYSC